MGENSKIEWTEYTFNPWWGCQKVSDACKNCYADTFDKRVGGSHWGPDSGRRTLSDANWAKPEKWNSSAAIAEERPRVFCASMADVFEDRPDLEEPRDRLWDLIKRTPNLDWLLLTKRPEQFADLAPWFEDEPPWPNVWLGVTAETQAMADLRLPYLLGFPALVRFVSAEPLLGKLSLQRHLCGLDWVIVGGESGHGARPMHPDWVRALRGECEEENVPFLFKQWGAWSPDNFEGHDQIVDGGGAGVDSYCMVRVGKKVAGRELDGETHDGRPYV